MGLERFYKSKEWESLRLNIIFDRLNENGETLCEHCGSAITKAYDIIGHHKIELTDDNVSDVRISLNPSNIMLVHMGCHNKLHKRAASNGKKVYLVWGAPLSGKSTYVRGVCNDDDVIVDIDNIWRCVCNADSYVKPDGLRAVVFGLHRSLMDMVRMRAGQWQTAWMVGTYPLKAERDRLCKMYGAEEIYIDTGYDECVSRLGDRPKEWSGYIDEYFERMQM